MAGKLFLLPVPLGETGGISSIPAANTIIATGLTHFFCEHERTLRRMLRRMSATIDLNAIVPHRLDKDSTEEDIRDMLTILRDHDGAIVSEAGMPCIADPGTRLVARAHEAGIAVVPLTGPSSLLLALAASGLNGQRFTFHGYLPKGTNERRRALHAMEQDVRRTGGAQIAIETPYRNNAFLTDVLAECAGDTRLCIAVNIDQPDASIITRTVAAWRKNRPDLNDRPCVFIIG